MEQPVAARTLCFLAEDTHLLFLLARKRLLTCVFTILYTHARSLLLLRLALRFQLYANQGLDGLLWTDQTWSISF